MALRFDPPRKMKYENTLIHHTKGGYNYAIYEYVDGPKAGLFIPNTIGAEMLPPCKSLAEAKKALNAYKAKSEADYKARWGDTCLYPCSVCGRAKCNH